MLIQAVETYLAVRRAADFKLDAVERYLRSFAQFATAQGDTHVVTHTAIAWAEQGASEPQRHNRLSVVVRFARFSHAEDPHHEVPPGRLFYGQRRRRVPYLFREEDLQALLAQAAHLGPPDSLHPHTYSTLLSTWTKVLPQFTLLENQSYISSQTVGGSLRPQHTVVGMTHTPKTVTNNTL